MNTSGASEKIPTWLGLHLWVIWSIVLFITTALYETIMMKIACHYRLEVSKKKPKNIIEQVWNPKKYPLCPLTVIRWKINW